MSKKPITIDTVLTRAWIRYPYLRAALHRLTPVERQGLGTVAVDQYWRLYYDPEQLNKWGRETAALIVAEHELAHLLREHHKRAQAISAQPQPWNCAADAEINDDLTGLPKESILPSHLKCKDGETAEYYYSRLPTIEVTAHTCGGGSGVTGEPAEHEAPAPGETSDAPDGATESEIARTIEETAREMQKQPGTVPQHWQRWANTACPPPRPIPWTAILRRSLQSATRRRGRDDYTYARPSRRQYGRPNIVPAAVSNEARVVVVVDTSGSRGPDQLAHSTAQVVRIAQETGAAVELLAVDMEVQARGRVTRASQIRSLLVGGGGTDMGAGIEAAEQMVPRPDACVVLTDGYTPWPPTRPRLPVIVVLDDVNDADVPSWAQRVRVKPR